VLFIKEIVGTNELFTSEQIGEQLKSIIVSRFTDAIAEAHMPVETYAANLNELSEVIFNYMKHEFAAYGLVVSKFILENVSMPEEIKKEIFELSRLNKVDISRLMQYKSAKAIEAAANNPSGVAGAGVGMGAGFGMAQQMAQSFNQQSGSALSSSTVSNTPPPLPNFISYFVAVNNQQAGPFDEKQLMDLAKNGQLTTETLVWNSGMSNWMKAESIAELKDLLKPTPPPLPNN